MTQHLLAVENLTKSYALPKKSLFSRAPRIYPVNQVSFRVDKLKNLGIAGESGSGKTTLARLIAQIEKQDAGEIFFEGQKLSTASRQSFLNFRKSVQFIFQDPFESINPKKTIFQTLVEPLIIHKIGTHKEQAAKVAYILNEVGLFADLAQKFPHQLSGGQRQRVAIARALMLDPKLIIADEPVSALDVSVQAQILNLLLELQDKLKVTYIVISHDLSVLRHFCDQVIIYYAGNIVELQTASTFFEAKNFLHPYSYLLLKAAFFDDLPPIKKVNNQHLMPDNLLLQDFPGCNFYGLCPASSELCASSKPKLQAQGLAAAACHHPAKISTLYAEHRP